MRRGWTAVEWNWARAVYSVSLIRPKSGWFSIHNYDGFGIKEIGPFSFSKWVCSPDFPVGSYGVQVNIGPPSYGALSLEFNPFWWAIQWGDEGCYSFGPVMFRIPPKRAK